MPTPPRILLRFLSLALALCAAAPPARADQSPAPPPSAAPAPLAPVETERTIAAPVADVWNAWTTPEGLHSFLQRDAKVELRPGGPFEIIFIPEAPAGTRGSEGCTVLSYLPQRMLSFSWNAPPTFPNVRALGPATIVVVTFTPVSEHETHVKLVHHGWPAPDQQGALAEEWAGVRDYFKKAWPSVLDSLAQRFKADDRTNLPDAKNGWVYLITLARPDLLQSATPEQQQLFSEHFTYLKGLTAKGTVIVAGPCTDMKAPGIVIFQAPDEAAARAIMNGDPAVAAGLFTASLHPMRLSLLRGRD